MILFLFSYPCKLFLVWLLWEGAAASYVGNWRVLTRGFGLYALALWFMGALRLVAWTFALPLDTEAFDEAFRYAYLVYGMLACTTPMFYLFFTRRSAIGETR